MITMKEEIAVDTWKAAVVVTMVVNVNNRKNIIDDCALVSMHTQHFKCATITLSHSASLCPTVQF